MIHPQFENIYKSENVNFEQYIMDKTNKIRNNSNPKDWRYITTNLYMVDKCSIRVKLNNLYQHTIEIDLKSFT